MTAIFFTLIGSDLYLVTCICILVICGYAGMSFCFSCNIKSKVSVSVCIGNTHLRTDTKTSVQHIDDDFMLYCVETVNLLFGKPVTLSK